ncbi:MAG TPA: putative toxin-antitoxin system toxin component, PIN family [Thermoflexia bacterium]|nr:putative toxin-antitoxin system toxin component, PIN family [Thermoflexia bacterium]
MRAVVDTNLLLRMAAAGRHFPLYQAWREKRFVLVTSLSMLDEFKRVIRYPRVRRFLSYGQGQGFVALLRSLALIVTPASDFPHSCDPSDDMVIATAVAARPCYLVTADRDLYDDSDLVTALRKLGVQVVQAGEFLAAIAAAPPGIDT